MLTRAAVCFGLNQPWRLEEVEVDAPQENEVRVAMKYAGLCHTDEHVRVGDIGAPPALLDILGASSMFPIIGGHEGAGVVEEVGPGVNSLVVGDHVAVSFIPSCGRCFWCATGRQNLCDLGAATLAGPMVSDRTWRHHIDSVPVNRVGQLGTFADKVVCHEASLVRIAPEVPFEVAALVSCGVATGFGSAVNRGGLRPGEVAVVVGCGGVGSGAILGALSAGARAVVAVDPVPFKLDHAKLLGASHTSPSATEALDLVTEITGGRMADVVVLTPGLLHGDLVSEALRLTSKDGRVVCTGTAPADLSGISINLNEFVSFNKALLGSLFGSASPRTAIPELLGLHAAGRLPVEALITRRYALEDVERAYDDLANGRNIRGVIELAGAPPAADTDRRRPT